MDEADSRALVKPALAGTLAALITKSTFGGYKTWGNVSWFGLAVAGGILGGQALYEHTMKKNEAKNLGSRTIEAGMGTAAGLTVDSMVNGINTFEMGNKTLTILVSEMLAEVATDYIYGNE
jgi:hypothetical protein